MKRFISLEFFFIVLFSATIALAQGVVPGPNQNNFDKTKVGTFPDLDQNRDYAPPFGVAETTWCAPTASANSVWYFGKGGYPNLLPAGPNNSAIADALIVSLGGLMGTADPNGTTIANTVAGLQQYFNNIYPNTFTVSWNSAFSLPDPLGNPSAQNLWNWMCSELEKCEDVLPILWLPQQGPGGPGYPGPPYDDPNGEQAVNQTHLDSINGHLVTMTGYNWANPMTINILDPDDNVPVGVHIFPPNVNPVLWNLALVGNSPQGTALSINGGLGGWIVGAISASPIPEPSSMLMIGCAGLLFGLKRKRS
jgi:hypothetical protein